MSAERMSIDEAIQRAAAGQAPMPLTRKTYEHVTPWQDDPSDHEEALGCCDAFVDEASRTVFHRPHDKSRDRELIEQEEAAGVVWP
jgi:hypothetical protein